MGRKTLCIAVVHVVPVSMLIEILLGCAGCGYFAAGTWEDDPHNWDRAFNSRKPDDVIVVHSKF
jgi:hypothetical protein